MLSRLLVALGFPSSAQVDLPRSECVFCRIADGNHGDSKTVLFQNDRIVVFPDASPGGAEHLQVCSRAHIQSVDSLVPGSAHHALVEEMLRVGREVCERRRPGAPAKFGFHVPPFTSVCHLHMHAIVLPHTPGAAYKYMRGAPWWLPADNLIKRLRLARLPEAP